MSYKLSQSSLNRLAECHEDLQILMTAAIKDSPIDFGISWGYRSPVKQNELYQQGRTTAGKIVTHVDGYDKKSKHNYKPALAADIKCYVNGEIDWSAAVFVEAGTHIMETAERLFDEGLIKNRIAWGGQWHKFKDWPHFQI